MEGITQVSMQDKALADRGTTVRVLSLYQQGKDGKEIAGLLHIPLAAVHKILEEADQKSRMVYVFVDGEEPATVLDVRNFTQRIRIVNLTDELTSRAFGIKAAPGWEDYEYFLESRCMPRTRYGIRRELKSMGIDCYDPFQIIQKTRGRVYEDHQYLSRMDADWIAGYDEIIKHTEDGRERTDKLKKYLQESERAWKLDEGQY